MAEATWEKPSVQTTQRGPGRLKFLIGGVLILASVVYLIISGTVTGARYYITVDDLLSKSDYVGKTVRFAGVVLGDTIQYDAQNLILTFTVANVPPDYTNLAEALHLAANDPNSARVNVRVENQAKPDLLQHEAQAILTGKLGPDGVFLATELNLKCPTRFEEAQPGKAISEPSA